MKKIILFSILSSLSICSLAQLKTGKVYLGGQTGLTISTQSSSTPTFTVAPYIGVMVADKMSFDLSIGYSNNLQILGYSSSPNSTTTKVGAFLSSLGLTQYIKLSDQFAFTISESLGFTHAEVTYDYNYDYPYTSNSTYTSANNILALSISPGAIYFPYKNFSMNVNLGSFLSVAYGVEAKAAQVGVLNFNTSGPKLGASFWF